MNQVVRKIPPAYLHEFLSQQTALIKSRTQLAAVLFVCTFTAGSLISSFLLHEPIGHQLILTWVLTVSVSATLYLLARKNSTIYMAKLTAALFMMVCLAVLVRYYVAISDPPFNVGMVCIFTFLGFSLMFPWRPKEIIGVLFLHLGTYALFILNVPRYIHKNQTFITELPDYLQGFIIMSLSFFFCYIVTKRERAREVENYILLKEIEKKNREIEERSEQMQKELELATRVHSRLIPHSVSTRLADIAVTYVPMYYMGGDYAKFHFLDKNKLMFIICDVTGHGVSAALLVNALNTEFERLVKEGKKPGDLLKAMDRFIVNDFAEVNMYLTAFCGLLEYSYFARKFTYSSYGHPPQYIYHRGNAEIRKIPAQTSFLGLPFDDEEIYENEIPFNKDDQILLFTDGVIEAKDLQGNEYGDEKLEQFIRGNGRLQAESFNQSLLGELNAFTKNTLRDDVFILNIQTK